MLFKTKITASDISCLKQVFKLNNTGFVYIEPDIIRLALTTQLPEELFPFTARSYIYIYKRPGVCYVVEH